MRALASVLLLACSYAPRVLAETTAAKASAAPDALEPWSTDGALTLPKGRTELALLGLARYGLTPDLELTLQPLVFFVAPHLEAKLRVHERAPFSFAMKPRVSYPTPFLNLIAREGSGGLLPATTDVPQVFLLEADAIASLRLNDALLASLTVGLAVAPRTHSADLPLLDFPFLYPRFAALETWGVPRAKLNLEGCAFGPWFFGVEALAYWLFLEELDGVGYAFEPAFQAEYRLSRHLAFELGVRGSIARYPVGTRFHYLPHLDVKVGF